MYSLRCRLERGLLRNCDTVTVVKVVVVAKMRRMVWVAMRNDVAGKFMTFVYGLSNDRCDGSSSKNECNGKLDLSHFINEM